MKTVKNGKIVDFPQEEYFRIFHPIKYAKQIEEIRTSQGGDKNE